MLKVNDHLLGGRGIAPGEVIDNLILDADRTVFLQELIKAGGILPINPPLEVHPYKECLTLKNANKYLIGTFPPINYILDQLLPPAAFLLLHQPLGAGGHPMQKPYIPFYHGNQDVANDGSMWKYFLTEEELNQVALIEERYAKRDCLIDILVDSGTNYSDIIEFTQRKLNDHRYTAEDKKLKNLGINYDLICHILSNPSAETLLFNTSSIFGNGGVCFLGQTLVNVNTNTTSFDIFIRGCQELGLQIEIQVQNGHPDTHFAWSILSNHILPARKRNKLAFEMAIINPINNAGYICDYLAPGTRKELMVVTPFSPAAVNRGALLRNRIVQGWLQEDAGRNTQQLLKLVYQSFRNNNLDPLYNLNV